MHLPRLALVAVCSLLPLTTAGAQTATTQQQAGPGGPAIGLTAGTLGLGAEASFKTIGNFVVRLNGTWADIKYDKVADGVSYGGHIKAISAGLIADWHPFAGGFRLSGGGRYLNGEIAAKASGMDVAIGANTYTTAQYGTLSLSVKNGLSVAPYIGLGYDNSHFAQGNWFFALDVGAMYTGTPKVSLGATGAVLAADLAAEQQRLQDEFGKYGRFIPVLQLAAKYRF